MLKPGAHFLQGNEAVAEAAIIAGCRFCAGYPITPASEILERLAELLPQVGGVFIQMEDEIAALMAVVGASWAGAKAMTATSGPGFSLMQEGIGYAFMTETPCVIVNVQRLGPATGQATKAGQGDVMQARWGTHGDYEAIVLSPNSAQEMFDLTIKAFNLSERYRTPVVILADEIVAHMRELVNVPPLDRIEIVNREKPAGDEPAFGGRLVPPMPSVGSGYNVTVTGSTHDERGIRDTTSYEVHRRLVRRLIDKIRRNVDNIVDVDAYGLEDCEIGLVSYGCTSRSAYEAVGLARLEGIAVGHVRLRTLWPFPDKPVRALAERAKTVFVPEMNLGQIVYEVRRAVGGLANVLSINKVGGGEMITPEEILIKLKELKG